MWALDVIIITVFTLISTDAPQVLSQTLCILSLFGGSPSHQHTGGALQKGGKYVALLNYWSGAHTWPLHTHIWDVFSSVYSQIGLNGKCWSMKTADRSVETSLIGDWLDPVSMFPAKSPSAGPPQLQSAPRLSRSPPVNTSYPQLSRSLIPRLSSSC